MRFPFRSDLRLHAGRHLRLFSGACFAHSRARHVRPAARALARAVAPAHGADEQRRSGRAGLLRLYPAADGTIDHAPPWIYAARRALLNIMDWTALAASLRLDRKSTRLNSSH